MKILFANKFFYHKGGSETVLFQERKYLFDRNVSVVDFSMDDQRNVYSEYAGHFVSHIDYKNSTGFYNKLKNGVNFISSSEAVNKLEKLIVQEKPDIAHLHNIYHQLTPSIISLLKKHNVKVILTLHDYKLICPGYIALNNGNICDACKGKHFWKPFTKNCQASIPQGMQLMLEAYWHKWRGSYNNVDCFIAPSEFMANMISRRVGCDKIRILHNGIDVEKYQPTYNDSGYGLYIGRISNEKGIRTLLDALDLINESIDMNIVGTGPLYNELKKRGGKAKFLGYKTGQALYDIIANSSFVVVPSEWYENCSMAVLEAMAMGKPVIGSNIGGIPEQVEDNKSGLLFEMGNSDDLASKMQFLIQKPDLRLQYGMAARQKLEREYSLQNHCSNLLEIYNQLLS
ncbi:MAG: glycosyltransferase family 4 protein [Desulfobacterales bacterium]|nr:glycosyltransferase family 4 protein [Desulfobacterales bacterium]